MLPAPYETAVVLPTVAPSTGTEAPRLPTLPVEPVAPSLESWALSVPSFLICSELLTFLKFRTSLHRLSLRLLFSDRAAGLDLIQWGHT